MKLAELRKALAIRIEHSNSNLVQSFDHAAEDASALLDNGGALSVIDVVAGNLKRRMHCLEDDGGDDIDDGESVDD